jgi:hypothetical protein
MDAAAATAASPMAFRNSGVKAGDGASSNSFWLRLYTMGIFNKTYIFNTLGLLLKVNVK